MTSVAIGNSVMSIGELAFSGCSGLTSVTIPNSVKEIGASAFLGCSGLILVAIGNGVTSIGAGAFNGCSGLTSVTIPNSVKEIGESAFRSCSALTTYTNTSIELCLGSKDYSKTVEQNRLDCTPEFRKDDKNKFVMVDVGKLQLNFFSRKMHFLFTKYDEDKAIYELIKMTNKETKQLS